MFNSLYQKFEKLYDKNIDGKGLAIFRILYALVLLCDVLCLYYFRHLIFDKTPYLVPGEVDMEPIILIWILSLIFIVFGLFTRTASIINYVASVTVIGTISSFQYHMFYSYISINFLLMFLPLSRCISLDRLREKLKYSDIRSKYIPSQKVSVLAYYIPLLIGVGFVYFDSIFFKCNSKLWLSGLGLWVPGSLPQAVIFNNSFLLNIKFLIISLGYLTLAFEIVFIFVFFRKQWRIPTLIVGVGLHLGILLFFPIPFFALGMVSMYSLMIPASFWNKLFKRGNLKKIKFYYDAECPLCTKTIIAIDHFDVSGSVEFLTVQKDGPGEPAFKKISEEELLADVYTVDRNGRVYKGLDSYIRVLSIIWYLKPVSLLLRLPGVYQVAKAFYGYMTKSRVTERYTVDNCEYVFTLPLKDISDNGASANLISKGLKVKMLFWGLIVITVTQAIITYTSPLSKVVRDKFGVAKLKTISSVYLGLSHHGVFVDSHFNGYNHIIAVVYISPSGSEKWLPIIDKSGMPGRYLIGPNWTKWSFRVNGPLIDSINLNDGIKDFTAFWLYKHSIQLDNAVFEIRVKKSREPKEWEYDFLNKQLANPWIYAGNVTWKNKKFNANIVNIEAL